MATRTAPSLTIEGFLNGNAGKGTEREGNAEQIARIFTASPFRCRMHITYTREKLYGAVRGIRQRRPHVIVLSSGDGGLNFVLTPILLKEYAGVPDEELPFILYLSSGTVRIVGSSLGLNSTAPEELAMQALAMLANGGRRAFGDRAWLSALAADVPVVRSHCLRIADEHGNEEIGFVWGGGIPVNFLNLYYEGDRLGKFGAGRVLFETFTDELVSGLLLSDSQELLTKPVRGVVTLPGIEDAFPYGRTVHTAIMASTVEEIGFGFKGMPLARSERGKFMVRETDLAFFELAATAPVLALGTSVPGMHDAVVDRMTVDWHEPTATTIDGEMREPHLRDIITCGPELRFLRP